MYIKIVIGKLHIHIFLYYAFIYIHIAPSSYLNGKILNYILNVEMSEMSQLNFV